LRASLPIKGPRNTEFFFRAKKNLKEGGFVWLDLRRPRDVVPTVGEQAAVIKVTPLFETPVAASKAPSDYPCTPEQSEHERAKIRDSRSLPPMTVSDVRAIHASSAAPGLKPADNERDEEIGATDAAAAIQAGASDSSMQKKTTPSSGSASGSGGTVSDQLRSGLSLMSK